MPAETSIDAFGGGALIVATRSRRPPLLELMRVGQQMRPILCCHFRVPSTS